MNILFAINEVTPFYKLGGLGDVGGSLPRALSSFEDLDLRLALPDHPDLHLPPEPPLTQSSFEMLYDHQPLKVTVKLSSIPGTRLPLYLFSEPSYINQASDASDNYADKYAVFSLAVATWIAHYSPAWQPHLVHCHDWHTALIPLLLKHQFHLLGTKTLLTIHNLAYQGATTAPVAKRLQLPPSACQILTWDRADGDTNILMEGIIHADQITTVSNRYAQEILTTQYGRNLEPILQAKQARLVGILNGIDLDFFNPATDTFLDTPYNQKSFTTGKAANKTALIKRFGGDSSLPLLGFVGRIDVFQKGIDLIAQYLSVKPDLPPHLFYFLGTGDRHYETKLHSLALNHDDIKIFTRFDEPLAHQIYAAADYLLIPSRYEPCGLIQMIAMHYGTLPIANRTGGLADTIIDNQTGFLFSPCEIGPMITRCRDALNSHADVNIHHSQIQAAMGLDFSWTKSAAQYYSLYHQLLHL